MPTVHSSRPCFATDGCVAALPVGSCNAGDRLSAACLAVRPAGWRRGRSFVSRSARSHSCRKTTRTPSWCTFTCRRPRRLSYRPGRPQKVEALLREQPACPELRRARRHPGRHRLQRHAQRGAIGNIGPVCGNPRQPRRQVHSRSIVHRPGSALRPAIGDIAKRYPDSIIQLVEDPPGPPVRATVLAELYGAELDELDQQARRVSDEFRRTYDMAEVWAVCLSMSLSTAAVHRERPRRRRRSLLACTRR